MKEYNNLDETMDDKCCLCMEGREGKPLYKKIGNGEVQVSLLMKG